MKCCRYPTTQSQNQERGPSEICLPPSRSHFHLSIPAAERLSVPLWQGRQPSNALIHSLFFCFGNLLARICKFEERTLNGPYLSHVLNFSVWTRSQGRRRLSRQRSLFYPRGLLWWLTHQWEPWGLVGPPRERLQTDKHQIHITCYAYVLKSRKCF